MNFHNTVALKLLSFLVESIFNGGVCFQYFNPRSIAYFLRTVSTYLGNLFHLIILFFQTIRNSSPSEDVDVRIKQLNTQLTWAVFLSVCRSLFERDKLLFSFMLCVRLQQAQVVYLSILKSCVLLYDMVSFC